MSFTRTDLQNFVQRGLITQAAVDHCCLHAPAGIGVQPAEKTTRRGKMNKTELAYSRLLETLKLAGKIVDWKFEPITLRWGDGMRYTPDFLVTRSLLSRGMLFIEVKGGHIWDRDKVRFKGCRAEWKEWFDFEMHQKVKGEWKRLE